MAKAAIDVALATAETTEPQKLEFSSLAAAAVRGSAFCLSVLLEKVQGVLQKVFDRNPHLRVVEGSICSLCADLVEEAVEAYLAVARHPSWKRFRRYLYAFVCRRARQEMRELEVEEDDLGDISPIMRDFMLDGDEGPFAVRSPQLYALAYLT